MDLKQFNEILNKQIEDLASNTTLNKDAMVGEKFDPLDHRHCILTQLFGSPHKAEPYRTEVGTFKWHKYGGGEENSHIGAMTPLEIWTANMWKAGNKEEVVKVYNYIKTKEGERPVVEMVIPEEVQS